MSKYPTFIKIYAQAPDGTLKWSSWSPMRKDSLEAVKTPFAAILKDWDGRRDRQPNTRDYVFKCAVFCDVDNPTITSSEDYTKLVNLATEKVRAYCKQNGIKIDPTPKHKPATKSRKAYRSRPESKEADRIRIRLLSYFSRKLKIPILKLNIGIITDEVKRVYGFIPKDKPSKFRQIHDYLLENAPDYF